MKGHRVNVARILPVLLGLAMAAAQAADPGAGALGSARAAPSAPASSDTAANAKRAADANGAASADGAANVDSAAHAADRSTRQEPRASSSAADSIQLETTEISGNRELPKLLYIVPWQRAQVGKFSGRPPNSLVDETLTPVDRSVFERQNRYYSALESSTQSAASQSAAPQSAASRAGSAPAPAAAVPPRDEK